MARRLSICAVALLAAVPALASDSDRDCTDTRVAVEVGRSRPSGQAGLPVLHELPSVEIVVVRLDAEGNPTYACVASVEAAKRVLDAPVEKLPREAREK